jgi:hypothetical protein
MKNIVILLLLFPTVLFSQNKEQRIERIKALKVAYISEKLDLTSIEAEGFWPIFNQFEDKQNQLQKQKKQLIKQSNPENASTLSEKETYQIIQEEDKIDSETQNNKRKLVKDLQGVIPNQKIIMLKNLEVEFKQKLLDQIKNHKERRFKR